MGEWIRRTGLTICSFFLVIGELHYVYTRSFLDMIINARGFSYRHRDGLFSWVLGLITVLIMALVIYIPFSILYLLLSIPAQLITITFWGRRPALCIDERIIHSLKIKEVEVIKTKTVTKIVEKEVIVEKDPPIYKTIIELIPEEEIIPSHEVKLIEAMSLPIDHSETMLSYQRQFGDFVDAERKKLDNEWSKLTEDTKKITKGWQELMQSERDFSKKKQLHEEDVRRFELEKEQGDMEWEKKRLKHGQEGMELNNRSQAVKNEAEKLQTKYTDLAQAQKAFELYKEKVELELGKRESRLDQDMREFKISMDQERVDHSRKEMDLEFREKNLAMTLDRQNSREEIRNLLHELKDKQAKQNLIHQLNTIEAKSNELEKQRLGVERERNNLLNDIAWLESRKASDQNYFNIESKGLELANRELQMKRKEIDFRALEARFSIKLAELTGGDADHIKARIRAARQRNMVRLYPRDY